MKILVDGRRLFAPGDRVRFVDWPAIEAAVIGPNIRDRGRIIYLVVFWDGESVRREIEADDFELEPVDVTASKD